jgi:hypothetical protein
MRALQAAILRAVDVFFLVAFFAVFLAFFAAFWAVR